MTYDKAQHVLDIISREFPRIAADLCYTLVSDATDLFPNDSPKALAMRLIDAVQGR